MCGDVRVSDEAFETCHHKHAELDYKMIGPKCSSLGIWMSIDLGEQHREVCTKITVAHALRTRYVPGRALRSGVRRDAVGGKW